MFEKVKNSMQDVMNKMENQNNETIGLLIRMDNYMKENSLTTLNYQLDKQIEELQDFENSIEQQTNQ